MTEQEQLKRMRIEILNNPDDASKDDIFKYRLDDAKVVYLTIVYPFNHDITKLPNERAEQWQVRCAIELYNNTLNEFYNASKYMENGVSISFAKAGISQDLLNQLPPPHAKVPTDE